MKIKTTYHRFILDIVFINIAVMSWLNQNVIVRDLLTALLLPTLLLYFRVLKNETLYLYLIIFYIILNFLVLGGSTSLFLFNMQRILLALMLFYETSFIVIYRRGLLLKVLRKLYIPLNVYMLLNIPAIIMEIRGNRFFSGVPNTSNVYYYDLISGLLGYNGTPMLMMFFVFFFTYQVFYYFIFLERFAKIFIYYNISLLVFAVWVSYYNHTNAAFFVFSLYAFTFYIIIKLKDINRSRSVREITTFIRSFIRIAVPGVLIFILLLKYTRLSEILIYLNKVLQRAMLSSSGQNLKSATRFKIIQTLFTMDKKWLGYGFGFAKYSMQDVLGFTYFGQSDLGSLGMLGGLIFLTLFYCFVYTCLARWFKNRISTLLMTICYLAIMFYTRALTRDATLMLYLLTGVVMSLTASSLHNPD